MVSRTAPGTSDRRASGVSVRDLHVWVGDGVAAVAGVTFDIRPGARVGLIGESGSGKTLTALSIMGLLPDGVRASGVVERDGVNLLTLPEERICELRGDRMGMVFQEPMSALNPLMRVGDQVAETLRLHRGMSKRAARARAVELLAQVQMPDPAVKARSYPHQLSGGQRQRAVIATAIACGPDLLIADEPTTALDVTVQAQILVLLDRLVREQGMALLLITHDLPVVASLCDEVLVMYGGEIVESGPTHEVFANPRHPYTAGLLAAIPQIERGTPHRPRRLDTIPGNVPAAGQFPAGCVFRDRCDRADEQCLTKPALEGEGRQVRCWHPVEREAS